MPRPRKKGRNVPPGVYFNKGRWFLRTDGREIRLAGADATLKQVWDAYAVLRKLGAPEGETLEWLCDQYLASSKFKKLAPATQRDYEICKKMICETRTKTDGEYDGGTLGALVASMIDAPTIAEVSREARGILTESSESRIGLSERRV
jgi:hypothetical protein